MSILTVVAKDENQVVLKVKDLTTLDIAMNPMFDGNMDYITVTRGKNHTLTVIKKDGKTYSFDWGVSGHTLISDSLERLKKYVLEFAKDNLIMLDLRSDKITKARAFYNNNFNSYQLTIQNDRGEEQALFFKTEEERSEMISKLNLTHAGDEPNPYVNVVSKYIVI